MPQSHLPPHQDGWRFRIGFPTLERTIVGMTSGVVVLDGGRSIGKTSLGLHITLTAIARREMEPSRSVLFLSHQPELLGEQLHRLSVTCGVQPPAEQRVLPVLFGRLPDASTLGDSLRGLVQQTPTHWPPVGLVALDNLPLEDSASLAALAQDLGIVVLAITRTATRRSKLYTDYCQFLQQSALHIRLALDPRRSIPGLKSRKITLSAAGQVLAVAPLLLHSDGGFTEEIPFPPRGFDDEASWRQRCEPLWALFD